MKYGLLKQFQSGEISNSQLNESLTVNPEDMTFSVEEQEIMDETLKEMMPAMIAEEILESYMHDITSVYNECMCDMESYLKTNGLLSESFAMTNPKKNYVRLNRLAILERLRSILILKLGRKNKDKNYKKYKIGTKLKRASFAELEKRYSAKATPMAKKLLAEKLKRSRIASTVQEKLKK